MKRRKIICAVMILAALGVLSGAGCELKENQMENRRTKEIETEIFIWQEDWEFAEFSEIHTGTVKLYKKYEDGKTIAVNAGHGTMGGSDVQTLCHPDGTPKVTGGSTAAGATYATAVSGGTTMLDGTPEAAVTLKLAETVKEKLLENGYNVLMIREEEDVQLDNIARSVFANENADCHLALHYDSTENDKGFFYISVPDVSSYIDMEPVSSHWKEHERLGESILDGMKEAEVKIFGEGKVALDLTQTSYSKVPSVDLEVGDRGSEVSEEKLEQIADGIVLGLQKFWS